MTLDDLIALLEKAEKPSDELDALIFAATHNPPMLVKRYPPTDDFGPKDRWQFWTLDGTYFLGSEGRFKYKAVTSSIDAALTLVPEGVNDWDFRCRNSAAFKATLYRPSREYEGRSPVLAIALCIAALKARKEQP